MAKEVKSYRMSHFGDGRVYFGLTYTDDAYGTITAVSASDALVIVDMLRNEKPVFMDEHGTLYTGPEPVGEGDRSPGGPPAAQ
jgi:hypothetical protein